jgi:hypothetical protein
LPGSRIQLDFFNELLVQDTSETTSVERGVTQAVDAEPDERGLGL